MKVVYADRLRLTGEEIPKCIVQGELIINKPEAYAAVLQIEVDSDTHIEACEEVFTRLSDEQDTREIGLVRTMSTGDAIVFGGGKVFVRSKNGNWKEIDENKELKSWRRSVAQQ